jgi:hypothetical protein
MKPKYHIGMILYTVLADDETGTARMEEWMVRTIRGGKVYAIWKNEFTYVKRSKVHGDWGWAKSIPQIYRRKWSKLQMPQCLHFTKQEAWNNALADNVIQWWEDGPAKDKFVRTVKRKT